MIPVKLTIHKFMNHTHSVIDFNLFNSALIIAKNTYNERKSNGLGKTSIFSAILYVLFGEVPTSSVNKIVKDGTDRCTVTFDFKIENSLYRIERKRSAQGRSNLCLFENVNGEWETEKLAGTRIPEIEARIAQLIKINYKTFIHSVQFAQHDLSGLSNAKNSEERLKILKEPLELGEYTQLEKIANTKLTKVRKDVESIETLIKVLGDPETDIKVAEKDLEFCSGEIKHKESSVEKLNIHLEEKRQTLNNIKNSLGSTDNELHAKITALNKRNKELKESLNKANERVQRNNKTKIENNNIIISLSEKQKENNDRINILNKVTVRDKSLIKTDIEKVKEDELYGTKLLAKFEAEYDQANKNLPNGDICSNCLQPITPEHRKKCEDEINKIVLEKSKEIQYTSANLTKCKNKSKKLQEEYEQALGYEKEINKLNESLLNIEKELEIRVNNAKQAEASLLEASHEMDVCNNELVEIIKNLQTLTEVANNSSVAEINKRIFAINDEIKIYEKSLENVRKELSEAQHRNGAAQQKLDVAKENLVKQSEFKAELIKLKKSEEIHEKVVYGFSSKGIPTFIINSLVDELQQEASGWLQKLYPELEFSFDSELNMTYRINGSERSYDQLSVGQKVYLLLGLKIALSRIIQKKLGIQIQLLLFDETDQPLDQAGTDVLFDVIKTLEQDFKILVITHGQELKEKFQHLLVVSGDTINGVSIVQGN